MNLHSRATVATGLAALLGSLHAPVLSAQGSSAGSGGAAPICMERIARDEQRTIAILPATDVAAMKAKGFDPVPCKRDFGSAEQREAYRDAICQMVSSWREELQADFERVRGERPAVLCGMAEIAIDSWSRGGE